MFINQQESFRSRFIQAISRPIQNRCAELAVLLDRATISELHLIFPLLIDEVFKPSNGINCWPLRSVSHTNNYHEFQALQHFFSTSGPIFKLIYNLINDPAMKYPFSVNYLPTKVLNNISGPNRHPFYADLIQPNVQNNQVFYLMLNPFDYYIFHFAYHLINPYCQLTGEVWNTVYYTLCCDYILHFLPIDSGIPILPLLEFYNGKNPSFNLPSLNQTHTTSKLFRTDVLNLNKSPIAEYHPRNKIWRSETIVTVFIDFWLGNDQVLSAEQSFEQNYSLVMHKQKIKINEIPTGEYIRIVRILVKQLHEFANSAKLDNSPMSELKKIVIPYIQGKMYVFLRHLIHHWPLDSSFRLVLELWLSFIQPWRYPGDSYKRNYTVEETAADQDEANQAKEIDICFIRFMTDNLLCYTVLFQQLLPRFNRVDLSSPKMALILYRLTKVFSQPHVVKYLYEVESCVGSVTNSPGHTSNNQPTLPLLSPTSAWSRNIPNTTSSLNNSNHEENFNGSTYSKTGSSGKLAEVVKQKMLEYEGPNFIYMPLFYAPPAAEVYDLLKSIKSSIILAESILDRKIQEQKYFSKGILGFLRTIFGISNSTLDEFTVEDRRKVAVYLEHSFDNLKEMFNLDLRSISQTSIHTDTSSVSCPQDDITTFLMPNAMRTRVLNSRFEGNPDLLPVQSNEVGFLVKLLYYLTVEINEKCSHKFIELYNEQSFSGRFARQLLAPPQRIYKYEKFEVDAPRRVHEDLPARVTLRYFASYKFLICFVFIMTVSKFFGYGYFGFPLFAIILYTFYIVFKAILQDNHSNVGGDLDRTAFSISAGSISE